MGSQSDSSRPDDDGRAKLSAFINSQDYLTPVDASLIRSAVTRDDLGITSLAVIMLVSSYMDQRGVDTSGFRPEWIGLLDHVDGIVAILQQIDASTGAHSLA